MEPNIAGQEDASPLCWILLVGDQYYPLQGAGDWKGCYFDEAAAWAAYWNSPVEWGMWRTLVEVTSNGTWREVAGRS